jgi:GntR family transcriptional regulator
MNEVAIDRQSVVPLYYQIQQQLLEQIRSGQLKVGEPVPSEQEISARLGVSRMTARQALKSLCSLGFVYSQRGKGTFVSGPKLEKDFRQLLSFSEEMHERGSQPRSKVLAFESVPASEEIATALQLRPEEQVIRLRRIRLADAVSVCIETTHLPSKRFPGLLSRLDAGKSLYATLSNGYNVQVDHADEVAEASAATVAEAKLLRVRVKAPVFRFTRIAFLADGTPVEFVKSVYRGDRCKVVSRLTRTSRIEEDGE